MGAALSLLQLQEYPENVRAESRSEGVELEEVSKLPFEDAEVSKLPSEDAEVSKLPSEDAEVSEQPSEEVSGEVSGWKECAAVLEIAGRGLEQEELQRDRRASCRERV